MSIFFSVLLSFFISSCGYVGGLNLGQYPDPNASPQNFALCHGYGCTKQTRVGFNDKDWNSVKRIFKRPSKDATAERAKIAKAIARIEKIMGETTGTKDDLPKAPLKRVSYQELDCIDETVNSTKYLNFLSDEGLLKFHAVGQPVYKGFMLNGVYPHNSASIVETDSGEIYVVDSYIYANGVAPDIRPLESWLQYKIEELPEDE